MKEFSTKRWVRDNSSVVLYLSWKSWEATLAAKNNRRENNFSLSTWIILDKQWNLNLHYFLELINEKLREDSLIKYWNILKWMRL